MNVWLRQKGKDGLRPVQEGAGTVWKPEEEYRRAGRENLSGWSGKLYRKWEEKD